MPDLNPIHVHYLREFTGLSLWYVHRVLQEENIPFAEAVNARVNIYRYTIFYDGERHPAYGHIDREWERVTERLEGVYGRHTGERTTESFEEEGLALLWPYLEKRLGERGLWGLPSPGERPYGCWSCELKSGRLDLHVDNVYVPKSPLSEMFVPFAASLLRTLDDARNRWPDVLEAISETWLNSFPRFQTLFPESWLDDAKLRKITYTMDHWGQFTNRAGDFHARNAARFRETGEMPYPCMVCECPIHEIRTHLDSNFPEAVQHDAGR